MPVPDTSGVPPWAEVEDIKNKINELVNKYNNLLVNLDSLNVVSLTANHIDTGTLDANVVTIRSDLNAGAFVQIDGNGMKINNGTQDTFKADIDGKVTMTGATVQSATGYPKVVMDPATKLFAAYYSATEYMEIQSNYFGAPSFNLVHNGNIVGRIDMILGHPEFYGNAGLDFLTDNNGNINLSPGGTGAVILSSNDFSKLKNGAGATLQSILNTKANAASVTGANLAVNGGIPIGASWTTSAGTVTWTGVPAHVHNQT